MAINKKVKELLKSGNFTILYHDNGECCLYEGKYKRYEDLPEDAEPVMQFYDWNGEIGYAPAIVVLLTKFLGGNIDSV